MKEVSNWLLSIFDTILVYICVFSLAGTVVWILQLTGIDVLGLSKYCDFPFSKLRIMICNARESSLIKVIGSVLIVIFWYIFYRVYRKHNRKYQNIDK
jgi:hypothetical protein